MTRGLIVRDAGPGVTVQDMGRPGYLASGLSRGGAADRLALAEGAVLLDQDAGCAALEMAGYGGTFEVTEPTRIALTGAPMAARAGDRTLRWNASHRIEPGEKLVIGGATAGVYGYLHVGGGIATPEVMGSRAAHLTVRLIGPVTAGATLPLGPDPSLAAPSMTLDVAPRMSGGTLRIVRTAQTALFPEADVARFEATVFRRDPRGNRQGIRLGFEGGPFATEGQLNLVSEVVVPGDIQMTGDGAPYVLMPECQTTGGYPRIGTVLPEDLAAAAQAAPGTALRFRFVSLEEALAARRAPATLRADLRRRLAPLVRNPRDIPDLLGYQLISGAVSGFE